jgi:photosystem II stability/assembly factor-like uncharacterized protein
MRLLRCFLSFILLVSFLSFGRAVQKDQAAVDGIVSTNLPITLREEDELFPIGPQGGSIVVMEMDPNNSNILYAGSWGSGMYKSLDGGLTWAMINQGLDYLYINSLAMNPQNPAILYAGTYEHGVYKTTDGGASWAATGPGMSKIPIVYTLAVDPVTPNVVYAGTRNQQPGPPWGGGLYKTTDGGGTWVKSINGITEDWIYDIKIDPGNHHTVYAASHSQGVFKSTNGAASWQLSSHGISDRSTRSMVIDPTNPSIVYVGTWHYGGVFKTTNGGISWIQTNNGLNHKIYSLHIDPKNSSIIYACTYRKGIMVTNDAAHSWHSAGLYPDLVYNVMIDPNNHNVLYAGTLGDGLYKSYDRAQGWVYSNTGLYVASITGLTAQWSPMITSTQTITNTTLNAIYAGTLGGGVYKTTDVGQTWTRINNGLGEPWVHSLAMSRANPQILYAGLDKTGFYITTDGGLNWIAGNNGLPGPPTAPAFNAWINPDLRWDLMDQAFFEGDPDQGGDAVAPPSIIVSILAIAVDSFDPNKLYVGTQGKGLYRSLNGGYRWATTNLKTQMVYAILSDPFTTSVLYAGCDASTDTLYRSLDGGATWNTSNTGMSGLTVYALAADPATPGVIYAGTSSGLYRSLDSGGTWALFAQNNQTVTAVGIYQSSPSTIFAGTSNGLFISYDGGINWKPLNKGLVNKEITFVALDPGSSPHHDLISTNAGGVFRHGNAIPASP